MLTFIITEETPNILKNSNDRNLTLCKSTKYMVFYENNKPVGCVGFIPYKNKAIYKNDYVIPEMRGRGIYKEMFRYRDDLMHYFGIHTIEATCTKYSVQYYLKNGYNIKKQHKIYTTVQNENISG